METIMNEISNEDFCIEIQDIEQMTKPRQKFNKKEYFKQYWIKNKDKLTEKYHQNHEEILARMNTYQAKRKEERRQYYLNNKEKILNQTKQRYRRIKEELEKAKEELKAKEDDKENKEENI